MNIYNGEKSFVFQGEMYCVSGVFAYLVPFEFSNKSNFTMFNHTFLVSHIYRWSTLNFEEKVIGEIYL